MQCGLCQEEGAIDILKDTFTDLDSLKSHVFCAEHAKLFDSEVLKTSFYIYDNQVFKIKQHELAGIIFGSIQFPSKISFSKSRKKHRLFRTKDSLNKNNIIVSTDDGDVVIDQEQDKSLFDYLNYLYKQKIPKSELLNGLSMSSTAKIGFKEFNKFKTTIGKILKTKKLELLVDMLVYEE
jgi:hypothetical protein